MLVVLVFASRKGGPAVVMSARLGAIRRVLELPVLGAHFVRNERVVQRRKHVIAREESEREGCDEAKPRTGRARTPRGKSLHDSEVQHGDGSCATTRAQL